MIILSSNAITSLKNNYGDFDMLPCYSIPQGLSAVTNQAILLMNHEKIIILYISKVTDKVVQKIEFSLNEISNSTLKQNFFQGYIWKFYSHGQNWRFKIPYVIPLRQIQNTFIEQLSTFQENKTNFN